MTMRFNVEKYMAAIETIQKNPHGSKALKEEIKVVNKYLTDK